MPVTADLSKHFYGQFGDDIVGEMVDWFNQMDAASHDSLRQFNELNFTRFDSKLEQRLAEFDARLEQRLAALEVRFERRLGEQSRWLVGIWITVIGAAAALWFRR